MELLKIGDRIINPENITHASFTTGIEDAVLTKSGKHEPYRRCDVSFIGCEEFQSFFNEEADQVWGYLSDPSAPHRCRNLTPRAEVAA